MPLALKIAPDLEREQIAAIADLLRKHEIDAVIATNTTIARDGVAGLPHGNEAGGLSGAPLKSKATAVVRELARALDGAIPVIAVGGIASGDDAVEKMRAGACLVQLYTGLIYRGPALVQECVTALCGSAACSIADAVAVIDEQRCIGCTLCIEACPVDAIVGAAKLMHTVIAAHCTGCELCIAPCPVDCISIRKVEMRDEAARRAAEADAHMRTEARNGRLARSRRAKSGEARERARSERRAPETRNDRKGSRARAAAAGKS